ncbi:hypothetical protein BaRGS_00035356 [Batillaria attramentaria]|uniref:Nocturnin n=1 Tax=Batillaria attramentaria TaxID=370345 RepID=A0ABD0JEW8_9CAEN
MTDTRQVLLDELRQRRTELNLPPLLKRDFQPASGVEAITDSSSPGPVLRVMQWNLLAQALSTGDDNFVLCPSEALAWDHRKLHILEEILTYDATVVCLEEVDHFSYIRDNLAKVGYEGCFFPKPDSPCLYTPENYGPDGCAMFWKSAEVECISEDDINLCVASGEETNQVAILCELKYKTSQKAFFVAVTHLKSKKPYWELRHEQGKYLENRLLRQAKDSPLMVCGDFNAEPTEQVYATFKTSILSLSSAYCHLSSEMQEPEYTTWKVRGGSHGRQTEDAHCIDYMFYTQEHLQPVSLLKMPTGDEIGEKRLPSFAYPSDHLSLVVDFVFKD